MIETAQRKRKTRSEERKPRKLPSAQWQLVELRQGRPMRELIEEALKDGKTVKELAKEWQISPITCQSWIDHLGLRRQWTRADGAPLK